MLVVINIISHNLNNKNELLNEIDYLYDTFKHRTGWEKVKTGDILDYKQNKNKFMLWSNLLDAKYE